jgi:3,4-dihydroxy 2-butanone 4-phosphate synthase/GTP cyclohydrolase II
VAKLQAYQLQDGGRDTVDANLDLGLPADARHYGAATQILRDLGVGSVRLLTNNPAKVTNLEHYGIPVTERVPLTPHPNDHNIGYLLTKRDRMGHHLPDLHHVPAAAAAAGTGSAAEPEEARVDEGDPTMTRSQA